MLTKQTQSSTKTLTNPYQFVNTTTFLIKQILQYQIFGMTGLWVNWERQMMFKQENKNGRAPGNVIHVRVTMVYILGKEKAGLSSQETCIFILGSFSC
jgi:hypothetical protein